MDDAGKGMWDRKEALKWLQRVNLDFTYNFAKHDFRSFRAWWDSEKSNLGIEVRFRTHP